MLRIITAIAILAAVAPNLATAEDALKLPRFVTIRSDEANLRSGPGARYPIKWVHHKKYMPVEVVQQYEHWRMVRDVDGDEGWIHKSLLSSKRYVLVKSRYASLHEKPEIRSPIILKLGKGNLAEVDECSSEWCDISHDKGSGWVLKGDIWGVYPDEIID